MVRTRRQWVGHMQIHYMHRITILKTGASEKERKEKGEMKIFNDKIIIKQAAKHNFASRVIQKLNARLWVHLEVAIDQIVCK